MVFFGWELSSKTDQEPVTIRDIMEEGELARWNAAHPDDLILKGDQILKVNNVFWDHDSTVFASVIGQQFARSRSPGPPGTLELLVRRPWSVQEAFDVARATQELNLWKNKSFTTPFRFQMSRRGTEGGGMEAMGWQLEAKGKQAPVVVSTVWKPPSVVAEGSFQNPAATVEPKGQIVKMNNVTCRPSSSSNEFTKSILGALQDAALDRPTCYFVFGGPAGPAATLALAAVPGTGRQRSAPLVQANM